MCGHFNCFLECFWLLLAINSVGTAPQSLRGSVLRLFHGALPPLRIRVCLDSAYLSGLGLWLTGAPNGQQSSRLKIFKDHFASDFEWF